MTGQAGTGPPGRGTGLDRELLAPHAVARWARTEPGAVALQHVGGDTCSYLELHLQSLRWAGGLQSLGVSPGSIVVTLLPNGPTCFELWLGLGWLRAVEAPLNPALRGDLLARILDDTGAELIVTDRAGLSRVAGAAEGLPARSQVVVVDGLPPRGEGFGNLAEVGVSLVDGLGLVGGAAPAEGLEGPSYCDVGALLYTSGTTGPSKGVLVTWASIYQTWSWVPDDALLPGEGLYCPFPMFHTSGKSALNSTLVRGGRFVWRDRFSATDLWADIGRADCSAASLVGPMLSYVHTQPASADDADNPLRSVLAGPTIPDIASFERRFGVRVATCYSMTEFGTPLATGWDHGPPATCGRPRTDYPWSEVRVVDEFDEPVGPGQVGELVVRTTEPWALTAGYHRLPEATAAAWRNGWFHSGDAFRVDAEGWYYLVDRMKDAVRRRGENISSFEVEQVVRRHPGIADCAVVGVPAEHGEDDVMVVVEVVGRERFDPAGLVAWLDERLPPFMVPRYVRATDALPRNETSLRVQKFRLRADGVTPTTWDRLAP